MNLERLTFLEKEMCNQIEYTIIKCGLVFTEYCPMTCAYAQSKFMPTKIKEDNKK